MAYKSTPLPPRSRNIPPLLTSLLLPPPPPISRPVLLNAIQHSPPPHETQVMSAATPCTTAWEEVGLSNLRPTLDEQALSIAEHQESSLESRRALAAQAKSFRQSVEKEIGATSDMRAASGALVSQPVKPLSIVAVTPAFACWGCPCHVVGVRDGDWGGLKSSAAVSP